MGLASQQPAARLQVWQFHCHLVSKSDLESSLSGINTVHYLVVISLFRVEGNLSLAKASNWKPGGWISTFLPLTHVAIQSSPFGGEQKSPVEKEKYLRLQAVPVQSGVRCAIVKIINQK